MSGISIAVGFGVGWPAWSGYGGSEVRERIRQIATTKLSTAAVCSGALA